MVFKWISASSLTFYYSKLLNNDSFNYIWCFTKFKHINLDIGIHKKREWIKPADFLWPVRYMHLAGLLHSSLCSWHNVSVGFLPCTFIATSAWDVAVNLTTALYWTFGRAVYSPSHLLFPSLCPTMWCPCVLTPLTQPCFIEGWEVYSDDLFIHFNHFNTKWIKPWYIFSSSLAVGKEKKIELAYGKWCEMHSSQGVALIGLACSCVSCLYQ